MRVHLSASLALVILAQAGTYAQAPDRNGTGQDAGQLGEALRRMEMGLLRNLPETASCVIEIALTCPDSHGNFVETARLRPLQLLWKSPAAFKLSFHGESSAPPAPVSRDDLSTTACQGPYFDMRMEGLFRALRKAKHLKDAETRLPGTHPVLGPVQIFLMTLRADPTARLTGHVVLADSPTLGMDFPNAVSLLPLGMSGKHVKLWMSEKDSLPARVMFSTRSFGVLSFDITYILRKDAHGLEYLLPDLITLQPLEDEDLPPTAFPVRVHFTNYKINLEVPDAAFE